MTEKDLRKLNRKQLLELLLKQTERADALQEQLQAAETKLRERTRIKAEAGSIAEAALKLNGVFEAAEKAAAQYIENVKESGDRQPASPYAEVPKKVPAAAPVEVSTKAPVAEKPKKPISKKEEKARAQSKKQSLRKFEQELLLDEILKEYTAR